jgi:Bacterial Ig-like domain (group 2)
MSSIRFSSLLILLPAAALAQTAYIGVSAPATRVLVGAQTQLTFSFTDVAGTPLNPSGLAWASSDSTVAKVDAQGVVSGIAPGDVSIGLTDPVSGASGTQILHVVPASFRMQATPPQIPVGQTSQLTAAALDAAGNTIPGLQYQFRSAQTSIATVDANGVVTGVAEGFTTMEAGIVSTSRDPALVTTIQIQVLPAAQYTVKKLISTDVTANTTIAAYSMVSATNPAAIASIVTLANGGQAAILVENGKTTVLAVAGQVLPNAGRMVVRLDAVSANSKGDVALLVEYPTQWCTASVILFPHGKPEQELGSANCNNGMHVRSLGEDGSVLYRLNNDQIFKASATSPAQLLFSIATQPFVKDPVKGVSDFAPSPAGTFILNAMLNSGAHVYLWFDGKQLNQVYRDGDLVRNTPSNNMDLPIGNSDGSFYARVNGTNFEALVQLAPGPVTTLLMTQDTISAGKLGWIDSVVDVSSGGILMMCDINVPSNYHTSVVVWQNNTLTEYAPAAGYNSMIGGAMLSSGNAITSVVLASESGAPALRALSAGGAQAKVLAAGAPFPQPAPAGIDWHYSARGGSATSVVARGAGDAVMKVDNAVQMLVGLGSTLPNGKTAVWIGGAIANQSGDILFTAGYPTGSALFRYRGGKFDTVMDNAVTGGGPNGMSLNYTYNYRGRFLAMNDRGDAVSASGYTNNLNAIVLNALDGPHLVAEQNSTAPGGGGGFSNFGNLAIDNNGNVMFIATTSDGNTAAYYWNGQTSRRLIGTGDVGPSGYTVNEISNVAGGGPGFLLMVAFGNYQLRELRYFDGTQMTTLESSATSLFDGAGLSYYWMNECTLAANGDAHCQIQTQDGGNGVYAHVSGGRDLIVARSRDKLPGGEWMSQPLVVSSSANGTVFFTADVLLNGVESLALYIATPR